MFSEFSICRELNEKIAAVPGYVEKESDRFLEIEADVVTLMSKIDAFLRARNSCEDANSSKTLVPSQIEQKGAPTNSINLNVISEADARRATEALVVLHQHSSESDNDVSSSVSQISSVSKYSKCSKRSINNGNLKRLEETMLGAITSISDHLSKLEKSQIEFKTSSKSSSTVRNQAKPLKAVHQTISEEDSSDDEDSVTSFSKRYFNTKLNGKSSSTPHYFSKLEIDHGPSSLFRLPKLELEPFDGDPLKWHDFALTFLNLVESNPHFSKTDKMAYLRHCLSPNIRKLLGDCLNNATLYENALDQLEQLFGNPQVLSDAYIRTIQSLPNLKRSNDYDSLLNFSTTLRGAVASLRTLKCKTELKSSAMLTLLIDKLPDNLKIKWGEKIVSVYPKRLCLQDFDEWIYNLVKAQMVVKHPSFVTASYKNNDGQKNFV